MLNLESKFVLLYTPTMTLVDGYDPHTGDYSSSKLPSVLLKKARQSLYVTRTSPSKVTLPYDLEALDLSPIMPRRENIVKENRGCCTTCAIF